MDKNMKQEAMMKVLQEIADMAHEAMGHKLSGLKAKPYAGEESESEENAEKELLSSGEIDLPTHAKMEAKEYTSEEDDDSDGLGMGDDSDKSKLLKLKAKLSK